MSTSLDQQNQHHENPLAGRRDVEPPAHPLIGRWDPDGWLSVSTTGDGPGNANPLAVHADWLGPSKLVGSGGMERRTEVFVSPELFAHRSFDHQAEQQFISLMNDLRDEVLFHASPTAKRDWVHPDADQLVRWLAEGGFQAAVAGDGNLRLTLKAKGCDGQVVGHCGVSQLRFVLRLGRWTKLDELSEQAMLRLAHQANHGGRLARIAWISDGAARCCQAQVDLTGLPTAGPARLVWPDMVCMAMHALELALRRLGLELDVLADPANREIASRLIDPR